MDPIDWAFEKLEGKVKRLSRQRGESKNEGDSINNGSEVGCKKPKRTNKLDSDSNTDYEKSKDESDSNLSEDKFEKGLNVQTDWYI